MGMCHEQPSSGWKEGWMLLLGHPLVKWHFIKKSHYWELEIVPARPVQITAQVLAVAVWMSVHLLLCCVAPSTWCTAWDLYHGWVRRRRNCFRSMGTCCQAGVLTRHWGWIKKSDFNSWISSCGLSYQQSLETNCSTDCIQAILLKKVSPCVCIIARQSVYPAWCTAEGLWYWGCCCQPSQSWESLGSLGLQPWVTAQHGENREAWKSL